MHMIFIRSNFKEFHLISCLNGKADLLENFIHLLVKHCPTILGRQHKMVQKDRDIVTLMDIVAHP